MWHNDFFKNATQIDCDKEKFKLIFLNDFVKENLNSTWKYLEYYNSIDM